VSKIPLNPQGYAATNPLEPALPETSEKRALFEQLRPNVGRRIRIRGLLGHGEAPVDYYVAGILINCLLLPASPAVYLWPNDELWSVKLQVEKADHEMSEITIDPFTTWQFPDEQS